MRGWIRVIAFVGTVPLIIYATAHDWLPRNPHEMIVYAYGLVLGWLTASWLPESHGYCKECKERR